MSMIRLLSTDFDGTLIGGRWGEKCAPSLASELSAVVESGSIWVVNTGRDLLSALDGIQKLGAPVFPEYILTSERHIHHPDGRGGWHDYGDWNRLCRAHHDLLFAQSGDFFDQLRKMTERYPGVMLMQNGEGVPEGLRANSEEQLDELMLELQTLPGRHEDFNHQRSDIFLRFCHRLYDKGSTLSELARLLDMPTNHILAVGDHQNDIAMLLGRHAKMVACPANAHHSVKETVRHAGGYVSSLEAGEGTAEAIRFYRAVKLQHSQQ